MNSSHGGPGKPGLSDKAIQAKKLVLNCNHCGARLQLDPGNKIIHCEYCGAQNVVPDNIWKTISPKEKRQPPVMPHPPAFSQSTYTPPVQPAIPQTDYVYTPPKRSKASLFMIILLPFVIFLISGSVALFSYFRQTGGLGKGARPVHGNQSSLVSGSAVAPSFENADPLKTAENIAAMVKKNWVAGARLGRVYMYKVRTDGTVDVSQDSDGSIIMSFYDLVKYKKKLPGEDKVKNGELTVNVINGYMVSNLSDASLHDYERAAFLTTFPKCGIKKLMKEVQKAGYPSAGFADISFPEIPSEFDKTWFKHHFDNIGEGKKKRSLKEKELNALWKKVSGEKWREKNVYSFRYSVSGFKANKLPRMFSIKSCKPTDTEKFKLKVVEKYLY